MSEGDASTPAAAALSGSGTMTAGAARLPERRVTVNQLVGFNMKLFRQAAGLTQEELGQRLGGWSKGVVSAAERSWDGDRIRQFDADELVAIARALGIPVIALLLPPPDSGRGIDYTFAAAPDDLQADDFLHLAVTDYQGDDKVMGAVRERLDQLARARSALAALQREADSILLEEAREFAEELIGEARETAEALNHDARERHRRVMANLVPQYEAMERRVTDLRAFEREYRRRLIESLEGQLSELKAGAEEDEQMPGGPLPVHLTEAGDP